MDQAIKKPGAWVIEVYHQCTLRFDNLLKAPKKI
jgi:hypothetical protein